MATMTAVVSTTGTVSKKSKTPKVQTTKKKKTKYGALPPYPLISDTPNNSQESSSSTSTPDEVFGAVANLLQGRKNVVVLVGAGISTSVGIPDFRSKDKGLYNTLDAAALGLSCPEDLFCIEFFKSNPRPFYKFAKHLYYPNQTQDNRTSNNSKGKSKPKPKSKAKLTNGKRQGTKPPLPVPTRTRSSQRIQHKRQRQSLAEADKPPSSGTTTASLQPGRAAPSDSHKLLALLEQRKMLLRVYTQNIDGLESSAGVSDHKIVYCHGSLRSMSCSRCGKKNLALDSRMLRSIEAGCVPRCHRPAKTTNSAKASPAASPNVAPSPTRTSKRQKRPRTAMMESYQLDDDEGDGDHNSNHNAIASHPPTITTLADGTLQACCGGVLKPGITFFGETLDHSVGRKIESDQTKADALIVIGTSLSVAPISKVIEYLPTGIPRILINRTIVHPKTNPRNFGSGEQNDDFRQNYVFDAYLLGFCDDVTRALGKQLGLGFDVEQKQTKQKRNSNGEDADVATHASDTGAKLLLTKGCNGTAIDNGEDDPNWRGVTVPKERILLFPGALPSGSSQGSTTTLSTDNGSAPATYQEVAHCDGCSKRIPVGKPIFKCSRCFDYDLCQSCYPKVSKLHCNGKHAFRKE